MQDHSAIGAPSQPKTKSSNQPAHQSEDQNHDDQNTPPAASGAAASGEPDWQQRAESAETALAQIAAKLADVEQTATDLHSAIESQRLARLVDVSLVRAGASDLDAARDALSLSADANASQIEDAITRLRSQRPGLFAAAGSGVQGELRSRAGGVITEAQQAADAAKSTGDRRQLLRYLRLRRSSAAIA